MEDPLSTKFGNLIHHFQDPVKMMILIKVLKQPDITSNELKRSLLIPGTKIFYYLKQLVEHDPPLLVESGVEQAGHMVKRTFRVSAELEEIFNESFASRSSGEFHLFAQYVSLAVMHHQIRVTEDKIRRGEEDFPETMLMFVDDDIAKELAEGVRASFTKCSAKYSHLTAFEGIRQCNNVAVAGIYPMTQDSP